MNHLKIIYGDGAVEALLTPMDYGQAQRYARQMAESRETLVRGMAYIPEKREAHRPVAAAR